MTQETLPLRQEIILGPDGHFVKRETREVIITNADVAINNCMRQDALCMSNIPNSIKINDKEHLVWVSHNAGINPDKAYATVSLPDGFPLPGARFIRRDRTDEVEMYDLVPKDNGSDVYQSAEVSSETPTYKNYGYDMYVQIHFNCRGVGTHNCQLTRNAHSTTAYLFGVHAVTGNVVTFNLPNIYDDGRICGGDDFRVQDLFQTSRPISNIYGYTYELISNLYETHCNRDLFSDGFDELLYTKEGSRFLPATLQKLENTIEGYKPCPRFFKPVTNSNLLDFVSCLKSTTN